MIDHKKLFRAIVVIGASLTGSCGDDVPCHKCVPIDGAPSDGVAANDAPRDSSPTDASVDAVIIL